MMKRNINTYFTVTIVLIFGLIACDNGTGPGTDDPFTGTVNVSGDEVSDAGTVTLSATEAENWWKTTAWSSKFGTGEASPWKWDSGSNRPVMWFE